MERVGHVESASGIDERTAWGRALREVYEFWRPKLGDDLLRH